MAGDWFPMLYWRSKCPEIVPVSARTGRTSHEVLGWLCDLWSWASSESSDGRIRGVYIAHLPAVLGADAALWEAVRGVGWLAEDGEGIVIPHWDHWLSESAKKRLKERRKKQLQRSGRVPKASPKCPRNVPATTSSGSPRCPRNVPPTLQDRTEEEEEPPLVPRPGDEGARPTARPTPPKAAPEADPLFLEFWSAYPRKTAKPAAARAFARLTPDRPLLDRMLAALGRHRVSDQWTRDGGQFVPHPATWLNQRRWEDEAEQPARSPPKRDRVTEYAKDTLADILGDAPCPPPTGSPPPRQLPP